MPAPHRLYVSDLHLCDPRAPAFRAFEALMQDAAARCDEIYLLGDLCEVWVGDDDDGPMARRLIATLAAASRRARVFVMHGNRDFLFGERFAREAGVSLIPDPYRLDDGVLLAHGDALCIDDHAYQQTRRVLRSPDWQRDVLARPLAERRALADAMRAESRAANANKAENIMDVAPAEVARVVRAHGARVLIHGHTHRPGIHTADWGRRYVLGAWERCGWRIEQRGDAIDLICFGLGGAA
ncbi:MAG TPA: UDP-2,3-diacylglucosamine diphosphatase [Pseudomonadales bacterium]